MLEGLAEAFENTTLHKEKMSGQHRPAWGANYKRRSWCWINKMLANIKVGACGCCFDHRMYCLKMQILFERMFKSPIEILTAFVHLMQKPKLNGMAHFKTMGYNCFF